MLTYLKPLSLIVMLNHPHRLLVCCWGLGLILIISGYFWLDRPIAEFIYLHQLQAKLLMPLGWFTEIPPVLVALAPLITVIFAVKAFILKRINYSEYVLLSTSITLICVYALKNLLKWVFGRYWPLTWYHNNPSWIQNHAYGFHWFAGSFFNGNDAMASFPSGHTTVMFTVMSMFALYYPRFRYPLLFIACAEGLCMILFDYHFFSDVIAGMLLGTTVALIAYTDFRCISCRFSQTRTEHKIINS